DHVDPGRADPELFADGRVVIAPRAQGADLAHDVDRTRRAAGNVFNQAHHQALALAGLDHHRRDLALTEHLERFEPAFAADQIITRAARTVMTRHRDRALEPDRLDIVDDLAVLALVARPRVEHRDPRNRDHFDTAGTHGRHQAASGKGMGAAMV